MKQRRNATAAECDRLWAQIVLARARGRCYLCKRILPLEAHHIIFRSQSSDPVIRFDPDFGVRLWPWAEGDVRPYATIGGGYYQYEQETQAVTTATWLDPKTEKMVTETTDSTRHKRHDEGFYPFVGVGAEMAVGSYSSLTGQAHVLIEAQYAWDADFHGADLGGLSVVAGLRFRW